MNNDGAGRMIKYCAALEPEAAMQGQGAARGFHC